MVPDRPASRIGTVDAPLLLPVRGLLRPLPIDPVLPDSFYDTPNEDRPSAELDLWWDRPYLVTCDAGFDVRCLDGGAWDRPTFYGVAPDMGSAIAMARDGLARWLKYRQTPTATILSGGRWAAVLMGQRPGDADKLLFAAERPEDVRAWLVANNYVRAESGGYG